MVHAICVNSVAAEGRNQRHQQEAMLVETKKCSLIDLGLKGGSLEPRTLKITGLEPEAQSFLTGALILFFGCGFR